LLLAVPLALLATAAPPREADAFCGFYVGGAGQRLFNNATMVVLLRDGTRTVLSMQNNYQGPPERFALVVPVPVVLQKENVKTLPREVFDRIDQLAAPRLVEYWEQDPCAPPPPPMAFAAAPGGAMKGRAGAGPAADLGVTVEAQFTVGEYEIVILSAKDSMGLDTWLRQNKYAIPEGAEEALKPYVAQGMKFFVAKVDTAKVKMDKGMAMLSPLRFHYDTEGFSLPVRLGLLNSNGTQDLIVHILARERYEVANRKNVTIPTNLDVDEGARDQFPATYAALFDLTQESNPGAAITEYAWQATSCDPCPGPPLGDNDFATLGGDAMPSLQTPDDGLAPTAPPVPGVGGRPGIRPLPVRGGRSMGSPAAQFTLTRLHMRYHRDGLADDLVFKAAAPITGGREVWKGPGKLEHGSEAGVMNNFQGRYAIRHPWKGPVVCAAPRRGVWGGPPGRGEGASPPRPARDLAFAPRGEVKLASLVRENVPEIGLITAAKLDLPAPDPRPAPSASAAPAVSSAATGPASGGCGCATAQSSSAPGALLFGLGALLFGRRRRQRAR
jgi:MYXO-CTERM domain-containing protein